ncbi:hypothetical protein B6D29_00490 [Microgenomates bacterium UTCPR1]|nr:MAG: hypothetical protein B6D29_00490 [Microgenomates bacterium UTCPR1]
MKSKFVLLLTLIILFIGFVIVKFVIKDKTTSMGRIKIVSSPTAEVYIDNKLLGKAPLEIEYDVGEHLLKMIPEGMGTGTASWNGKINIFKNSLTFVNRELGQSDIFTAGEIFTTEKMKESAKGPDYGEIYVETEPQGAIVTLDNDEKGVAPMILQDVMRGDHELSVFMPGFFRRTQRINVNSGYRVNAFFKLSYDQSQKLLGDIEKESTKSGEVKRDYVTVSNNPQGWLRVRADASINASEEAKVKVGEKFEFLEEKDGWYKIKFNDNEDGLVAGKFKEGWISKEYASKE